MRCLDFRPAIPALTSQRDWDLPIFACNALGASSDILPFPALLDVVSTHSNAINCSDASGRRWTVITDPIDFLPRAILLDVLPNVKRGDLLFIDLTKTKAVFQARLHYTKIGDCRRDLIEEWNDFLYEDELVLLWSQLERGEPVHGLSGLGPGFTPAGDDFITGWITARRCSGSQDARFEVRQFYESWNPHCTNWFSQWMIKDAARGRIWQRGAALIAAMGRGYGIAGALNDILTWGHTSGRAWLAGFAHGFATSHTPKEMISCKK